MSCRKGNNKLVILTGGGTAGSVTPLLAIAEILSHNDKGIHFLWLGTAHGPERQLVEEATIPFVAVVAGKLRRYWSWRNIIDIIKIIGGFFQGGYLLIKYRPKLVVSAGSFVSVPIAWAAKILGIPLIIEQLDYRPGLANKLMAKAADCIVVTFAKSLQDYGAKAVWLGAPISPQLAVMSYDITLLPWEISQQRPVVLIMGGGTGALALNEAVYCQIEKLTQLADIIHITGKGKGQAIKQKGYFSAEFLNHQQIITAYKLADIVVARAGLGTMIELAALAKPSILVPLPNSHQLDNARVVAQARAAIILQEKDLLNGGLTKTIEALLVDNHKRNDLSHNWSQVIKVAQEAEILKIFGKYL